MLFVHCQMAYLSKQKLKSLTNHILLVDYCISGNVKIRRLCIILVDNEFIVCSIDSIELISITVVDQSTFLVSSD